MKRRSISISYAPGLLQTAKLEASSVTLHTEPVIVSKLVKDVVADLSGTLKGHPLSCRSRRADTPLQGDRELLKMILTQYLDNAAKYSAAGRRRSVLRCARASRALLSVRNRGSLIQMQDRERVFERFYRGSDAKQRAPGTGVGLSIVKKAAEAHHGHVWVVSAEDEGTTFFCRCRNFKWEVT
jgi:two-component system sensor histidine kinase KdpD